MMYRNENISRHSESAKGGEESPWRERKPRNSALIQGIPHLAITPKFWCHGEVRDDATGNGMTQYPLYNAPKS
ncbi:hypothetical protein A2Y83_02050 [Candidatus Falkowbacteria bacterium RBG_13_39_14]|uniref:Uncharacterized protein n=1 Tax=Candidatus Falkowbacteria bacterium RBG_13_39_14 TaxID=1797985 RepID=A0A1F5S6G6_9BACT|nr:MAG: hypothetical protein A2Y83_02050 [Candidatus Falkowbacteria bacterium RBG_13_39_14]